MKFAIALLGFLLSALQAQTQEKIKIIWIDSFTNKFGEKPNDIIVSQGDVILANKLKKICKNLWDVAKIDCQQTFIEENVNMPFSNVSENDPGKARNQCYIIIKSTYVRNESQMKYDVTSKIISGKGKLIELVDESIDYTLSNLGMPQFNPKAVKRLSFRIAQEIYRQFRGYEIEYFKLKWSVTFPESGVLDPHKKYFEEIISTVGAQDWQIKVGDEKASNILELTIKVDSMPSTQNYSILYSLKKGDKPLPSKPLEFSKDKFSQFKNIVDQIIDEILQSLNL